MEQAPILKDLHIRITSMCNMNCPHCYAADWFKDKTQLDFDTVVDIVKQAMPLGCRKVTFTGGEPLVSEALSDSIEFCLKNALRVEVETNGMLIEKLVGQLGDNTKKVEFAVSYDGTEMRGNTQASIVRKNIEELNQLGCDIKIQTVITSINERELEHIFGFSEGLGIRNRVFLAHSPNGNGRNLSLRKMKDWLTTVNFFKQRYKNVIIELPDIFSGGGQKKCGWGVHRCEIMPNGDVTSCAPITFNHREFSAGNIKDTPLKDIWMSKHFKEIRNLHQKDFDSLCAKCIFWKTCLGACRSISYSTGGKLLSPHPFCVELFEGIKSGLVQTSEFGELRNILDDWMCNIENPNYKGCEEVYEDIVKAQHKLI